MDPTVPTFDERWAQLLGLPQPEAPGAALPFASGAAALPMPAAPAAPVPVPVARPPDASIGQTLEPDAAAASAAVAPAAAPATSTTPTASGNNALIGALRGVSAPAAPVAQKIATPHAPVQRPIQGGELVNMLAALGMGPRDVFQLPKIRS